MDELITLRENIQNLSKFHQIEVFRILKKNNVEYTENRNGIFVNMNKLEQNSITLLDEYLNYVCKQQTQIENMEKKAEHYKKSFFKNNKESLLSL